MNKSNRRKIQKLIDEGIFSNFGEAIICGSILSRSWKREFDFKAMMATAEIRRKHKKGIDRLWTK